MLKGIISRKERKMQMQVARHLQRAVSQLDRKMYNGAMIDFDKAMGLDLETVNSRLRDEMDKSIAVGDFEAALSIGLNILKYDKTDFELANKLGNFARRNGDYKQANSLYRTALRINRGCRMAFFNLAASLARVQLFDKAAIQAVLEFKDLRGYVFPDYVSDEDPVRRVTEKLAEQNGEDCDVILNQLREKREEALEYYNISDARDYELEMKRVKRSKAAASIEQIYREFLRMIKEKPEKKMLLSYDLAIYALKNNHPDLAEKALENVDDDLFAYLPLLHVIILDQNGSTQQASESLVQLLSGNPLNRLYNVNLGLMYRRAGNNLLSAKYLIKTCALLKQSEGLYDMHALEKAGDGYLEAGKTKGALKCFVVASSEVLRPSVWIKIGDIYLDGKRVDEAEKAFKKALDLGPDDRDSQCRIRKIHDVFVSEADSLMEQNKFIRAVKKYERALSLLKTPETLKKTANVHRILKNFRMETQLLDEFDRITRKQKEQELERLRQALIIKANKMLKQNRYQQGIDFLEKAFDMQIDRNVYEKLAKLYVRFKGKDSLAGLERRWNEMVYLRAREIAISEEKDRNKRLSALKN